MSNAEPVPVAALLPVSTSGRLSPELVRQQANEIRELQKAALTEGVDYGRIPNTPKPTLFQPGAQWLLKWAAYGHKNLQVGIERDKDGRPFGVTYSCIVHALGDPDVVIASADGYCGYDEPDREEHVSRGGKKIPRSPWNTVIKMAQKRALVAAALAATAASGVFTQDVEDFVPDPEAWARENGWQNQAEHDAYRETVLGVLKTATPEEQAAFKAWREGQRIPGFGFGHTRDHADLISSHIFEFVSSGRTTPGPESDTAGPGEGSQAGQAGRGEASPAPTWEAQLAGAATAADMDGQTVADLIRAALGRPADPDQVTKKTERAAVLAAIQRVASGTADLFYLEDGTPVLEPAQ